MMILIYGILFIFQCFVSMVFWISCPGSGREFLLRTLPLVSMDICVAVRDYNKNMRVKKALEKYLGSIYPAAEVEIFDFCFCGRANIAVMSDIAFGVECQWSLCLRSIVVIRDG